MGGIRFIPGIRAHQPGGNLPRVFAEAYRRSYFPYLEVLSEFPQIPSAPHYSGVLPDWLEASHPGFLDRTVEVNGKQAADPSLFTVAETRVVGEVRIVDAWLGLATRVALEPPGALWRCPVLTISRSATGREPGRSLPVES